MELKFDKEEYIDVLKATNELTAGMMPESRVWLSNELNMLNIRLNNQSFETHEELVGWRAQEVSKVKESLVNMDQVYAARKLESESKASAQRDRYEKQIKAQELSKLTDRQLMEGIYQFLESMTGKKDEEEEAEEMGKSDQKKANSSLSFKSMSKKDRKAFAVAVDNLSAKIKRGGRSAQKAQAIMKENVNYIKKPK